MGKVTCWALAGSVLLLGGAAGAEERVIREEDRVVVKKTSQVDFNEVQLDGDVIKPDSGYIHSRPQSHFDNLIKPRTNFVEELEESVDQ